MLEPILTELCAGSRLASNNTRFALVFHVEGLINHRVYQLLKEFGKAAGSRFRPLLTCITPLCPMYSQDPRVDPLRLRFSASDPSQKIMSDFSSKLNELAAYYDIGYHGHFFCVEDGAFVPSLGREAVLKQFDRENQLLADIGFRPDAYAGGWWFIAPWLTAKLRSAGYKIDTTINDVRRNYFGRQPYAPTPPGEPFWIEDGLIEVPSIRRVGTIIKDIVIGGRGRRKFVPLALHDYNLLEGRLSSAIRTMMLAAAAQERVLSVHELVEESTESLREHPGMLQAT